MTLKNMFGIDKIHAVIKDHFQFFLIFVDICSVNISEKRQQCHELNIQIDCTPVMLPFVMTLISIKHKTKNSLYSDTFWLMTNLSMGFFQKYILDQLDQLIQKI